MYKDEDYLTMTAEQFVVYIRKTHPKYLPSLPEKLKAWIVKNPPGISGTLAVSRDTTCGELSKPVRNPLFDEDDVERVVNEIHKGAGIWAAMDPKREQRRFDLLLKVIESNKLVGANADTVADYAIELVDALLKKYEE